MRVIQTFRSPLGQSDAMEAGNESANEGDRGGTNICSHRICLVRPQTEQVEVTS